MQKFNYVNLKRNPHKLFIIQIEKIHVVQWEVEVETF